MPAHVPVMLLLAGGLKAFGKECQDALADCGIDPALVGPYRRVDAQKDAARAVRDAHDKDSTQRAPTDQELWLANCTAGHIQRDASYRDGPRRDNCRTTVDGYTERGALTLPLVNPKGAVDKDATMEGRISALEERQAETRRTDWETKNGKPFPKDASPENTPLERLRRDYSRTDRSEDENARIEHIVQMHVQEGPLKDRPTVVVLDEQDRRLRPRQGSTAAEKAVDCLAQYRDAMLRPEYGLKALRAENAEWELKKDQLQRFQDHKAAVRNKKAGDPDPIFASKATDDPRYQEDLEEAYKPWHRKITSFAKGIADLNAKAASTDLAASALAARADAQQLDFDRDQSQFSKKKAAGIQIGINANRAKAVRLKVDADGQRAEAARMQAQLDNQPRAFAPPSKLDPARQQACIQEQANRIRENRASSEGSIPLAKTPKQGKNT